MLNIAASEAVEGLSWPAYRRVTIFIKLPATAENKYRMRLVAINPEVRSFTA